MGLQPVAQRQQCRQKRNGWSVVGMATGIGFSGEVLRHRDLRGQFGLLGGDLLFFEQLGQQTLWRWAEPFGGYLHTRGLGDDTVWGHDVAVGIGMDSVHTVSHDVWGQIQIGREI